MSRRGARDVANARTTASHGNGDRLQKLGIVAEAGSSKGLVEEAPEAYKDVDAVVDVVDRAGLAKKVARLVPIGVIKG